MSATAVGSCGVPGRCSRDHAVPSPCSPSRCPARGARSSAPYVAAPRQKAHRPLSTVFAPAIGYDASSARRVDVTVPFRAQQATDPTPRSGTPPRPRRRPYLSFSPPLLAEEELADVVDTLRSDWLTTGPPPA